MRDETDYVDAELRRMIDDPELKSNMWAECMSEKGWVCTAIAPIECSVENDGPVEPPFG